MSKSKKQLKEELAVVQQQPAEATSLTHPAAVSQTVSADALPTWLQHLLVELGSRYLKSSGAAAIWQ